MTATVPLRELAAVIRSKNAGPYEITFDVMFNEPSRYAHVRDSGVLNAAGLSALFNVAEKDVRTCVFFEPALAFKFTIVRGGAQGSVGERDTFGAQQHGPLLDIRIPVHRSAAS
ncbi:DUF4387 domain-containing protein [Streptomyces sp. NBC_00006]|uniref:DUF4387 domain-containing protein n=1 Tax=unclassified Streptomyces TaxID=2593676 RepID=UPI00225A53BC|nr:MULTISPECIES: DUF4387 domain-containing protein [unclassified Streptomyces]MCX5535836.1 DUF4387 domain-containing protein [Streptomyces sp. NBC_00006]